MIRPTTSPTATRYEPCTPSHAIVYILALFIATGYVAQYMLCDVRLN